MHADITFTGIENQHYSDKTILLAAMFYMYAKCSARSIEKIFNCLARILPFLSEQPDYGSILLWVKRLGLDKYKERLKGLSLDEAYQVIIDESIVLGDAKLQLTLLAPAQHPQEAMTPGEFLVADMDAGKSHNAEQATKALERVREHEGKDPAYGVSDNGPSIVKGIKDFGIPRHRDVSHTFGLFLKDVYGNCEDFIKLDSKVGELRRFAGSKYDAYLAPKMRKIARFMNLYQWIGWAWVILHADIELETKAEKDLLFFVSQYGGLVDELHTVMDCIEEVLCIFKTKGLSRETARRAEIEINQKLILFGGRAEAFGNKALEYIRKELALVKPGEIHNISSDAVENMFGVMKERMCPNKRFGITTYVLTLPLYGPMYSIDGASALDVRGIKDTKCKELYQWGKDNLPISPYKKFQQVKKNTCLTN